MSKAFFHLPGLFEFYDFYKVFFPLYFSRHEYFYDFCEISSVYGSPADCIWGGGRAGFGNADAKDVFDLMNEFKISARLTFSNSLLQKEHLSDKKCNDLCKLFEKSTVQSGIIISSDLLLNYIKEKFPCFYFVSSTTKVLVHFDDFKNELCREDFKFAVSDFRLNTQFEKLKSLSQSQKDKTEFLCNECCDFDCKERKSCYENVSRLNLGENVPLYKCASKNCESGYKFSNAMKNPGFIGISDIQKKYLPMGFSNFKIEGRSLGSAVLLEFLLHYLTKPEHQLEVREALYLDSELDLF